MPRLKFQQVNSLKVGEKNNNNENRRGSVPNKRTEHNGWMVLEWNRTELNILTLFDNRKAWSSMEAIASKH